MLVNFCFYVYYAITRFALRNLRNLIFAAKVLHFFDMCNLLNENNCFFSHFTISKNTRVRQMARKNQTAPLIGKCDHCLRSPHYEQPAARFASGTPIKEKGDAPICKKIRI